MNDVLKTHSQWVSEKVAEAREAGLRDGMDTLTIAHVVATLFNRIEELEAVDSMAIGWAYAYACSLMDKGVDIREIEAPAMLEAWDADKAKEHECG